MVWAKKDDECPSHPKIRAAGLHGRALWDAALCMCAKRSTDGVVEPIVVQDAAYLAEVKDADAAAARLVEVGLWHDARSLRRCARCREACPVKLDKGHFYFHDWNEYQLDKASQSSDEAKRKDARRRRLHRNKALIDEIRERDGSLCRYCAKRVDFEDRRSDDGGTYDHVDPDGGNTLDNVVVACRGCNIAKGHRTPTEAGMPLLAPGTARPDLRLADVTPFKPVSNPGSETDLTGGQNETDPDQIPVGTESDPDLTSRASHARLGTGSERVRNGSDPGSEDGSEQAGSTGVGDGSGPGLGPGPVSAETTNREEASA